MRLFVALISLLLLSACGSGSGDGSGTDQGDGNSGGGGNGPVVIKKQWGELSCQKNKTCSNTVLNLKERELLFFLESRFIFSQEQNLANEFGAFFCGSQFFEEWSQYFPQTTPLENDDIENLSQLGKALIDLSSCELKGDFANKLLNYFYNTKEYKDEN